MARRSTTKKEHYVDNKEFLAAMIEYKEKCEKAKKRKRKNPPVTNYIGECFLKIANHLSYRPNFINYTFRDDMISDGIENCLQYLDNFNPKKSNNPFAYFTQISWYAFLRRIEKEKKQQDIKLRYIAQSGIEEFLEENGAENAANTAQYFVDTLRMRIDTVKSADQEFKEFQKEEKKRKRRAVKVDSDLSDFLVNE